MTPAPTGLAGAALPATAVPASKSGAVRAHPSTSHPLDPPTAPEVEAATRAAFAHLTTPSSAGGAGASTEPHALKVMVAMLREPAKAAVIEALHWAGGASSERAQMEASRLAEKQKNEEGKEAGLSRQMEVVVIDRLKRKNYEVIVELQQHQQQQQPEAKVLRATQLAEGVQPNLTPEELCQAETLIRKCPHVIAAAAQVGLKPEQLYADGWSIGYDLRWPGRRLQQALLYARLDDKDENLYAKPVDFFPVLDADTGEILAIDFPSLRLGGTDGAQKDEDGYPTSTAETTAQPEKGSFEPPAGRPRFAPPEAQSEYLPERLAQCGPETAHVEVNGSGNSNGAAKNGTSNSTNPPSQPAHPLAPRADLKPLSVVQPQGVSFTRTGNVIEWQKWKFHVAFHPREGLVLSTVSYRDTDAVPQQQQQPNAGGDAKGVERPLFYRMSLAEMVVPYGNPDFPHYKKFAFDVGEYGLGALANPLDLGCDCLGTIDYMDGVIANHDGSAFVIKNAVCIHEEDAGLGWKHTDFRVGGRTASARNRKLVVSSVYTVSNYEYRIAYAFGLDGTIDVDIGLTGILNTSLLAPGEPATWGTQVAPRVTAHIHQHLFSLRLDAHIDGPLNSVLEQHIAQSPHPTGSAQNWAGNAFDSHTRVLRTAGEAVRDAKPEEERMWIIANEGRRHYASGKPAGYKLMLPNQPRLWAKDDSICAKRAQFAKHAIWTVPYAEDRKYPAGKYCVQTLSTPADSLPNWVGDGSASVANEDIVTYVTVGVTHVVRPEDYPVMPREDVMVKMKPSNFFVRNPMLDVVAGKDEKSVLAQATAAVGGNGHAHANGHANGNGNGACCA